MACGLAVAGTGTTRVADAGAADLTDLAEPAPPAIGIGVPFVFPTGLDVPGLAGQRVLSSTGSQARWAYLPGAQSFNTVLTAWVGQRLQEQASARGGAYAPEAPTDADLLNRGCIGGSTSAPASDILADPALAPPPGDGTQLALTCEPVLAAGTVLGLRLRVVTGTAHAVTDDLADVLYADTSTGDAAWGRDLFTPEGMLTLLEGYLEVQGEGLPVVGGKAQPPAIATVTAFRAAVADVVVAPEGEISVAVRADFTATAGSPHGMTLTIPAEWATGMLTPLGLAVWEAATSDVPWNAPQAVPAGRAFVDCRLVPCVAVTWDDGPSYLTPQVLDAFAARPYAATTFFVLGHNIGGREATLERAIAEGHEVENHSWSHPVLTQLSDAQVLQQVGDTSALIEQVTGVPVKYLRPPYGAMNARTRSLGGLPSMLWTVDTNDWRKPGVDAIVGQVVWGAVPDDIVLLHDIHPDSVEAAAPLIDGLLARGFTLVTLDQLLGGAVPAADTWVWSLADVRAARG